MESNREPDEGVPRVPDERHLAELLKALPPSLCQAVVKAYASTISSTGIEFFNSEGVALSYRYLSSYS